MTISSSHHHLLILMPASQSFQFSRQNNFLFVTHFYGVYCHLEQWFGISDTALYWFTSYLHSHTQTVMINNLSTPIDLSCGVPQGLIPGPLLFTLYTTPLDSLPDDTKWSIIFMPMILKFSSLLITLLQTQALRLYLLPSLIFTRGWIQMSLF